MENPYVDRIKLKIYSAKQSANFILDTNDQAVLDAYLKMTYNKKSNPYPHINIKY